MWLSIFESIYVIYMFNHFKTTINFSNPQLNFNSWFMRHPTDSSVIPQSMICPFGKTMSYVLGFYFIMREFINLGELQNLILLTELNTIVLILSIMLSLLNFNATVYLIPIFLIEIYKTNDLIKMLTK